MKLQAFHPSTLLVSFVSEWRLRRVVEHKKELEDELRRVNLELEEQVNSQRYNNCIDSNIQSELTMLGSY